MLRLLLAGTALCGLTAAGIALHEPGEFGTIGSDDGLIAFVVLEVVAGLVWAAAAWLVLRRRLPGWSVWVVLAVAVALRVAVAAAPPSLSTDLYRYVWDGRVQVAGHNPYSFLPNADELAALRDEGVYPHINRFDYAPTIYPPVAQGVFAAVAAVLPDVWGIKAVSALADLGCVLVLVVLLRLAGRPARQVLVYAWHPLPVWEFAGNAHVDGLALLFIALAVWAAVRLRPGWAGAALAAATLCKFLPLALAPAVWRRWDWRAPAAGLAVVVAGYGVYLGAGWRVLGFLGGYAQEEGLGNGAGFFVLRGLGSLGPLPGWAGRAYLGAGLLVLAGLAVWAVWRDWPGTAAGRVARVASDGLVLGTALIVVLSPHYPWYGAFLVWFVCVRPAASVAWLTLAMPLLYLDERHDQVVWPVLIYVPFAALAVRDVVRVIRADRVPATAGNSDVPGGDRGETFMPARGARGSGGVA